MNIQWGRLLVSVGISLSAGFIGSFFTMSEIATWYATLEKPVFNPPNWIFGPVWTTLYILMGIALYLVWNSKAKKAVKKRAITYFFLQLFLNTLWSILFFGLHQIGVALVEIVVMWGVILATIIYFRRINKSAAYLLYPYLAWVSFASILNLSIFLLN